MDHAKITTPRLPWIDAVRGVVMVLVVLGHNILGLMHSHMLVLTPALNFTVLFMYAFHMPALFWVSGLVASEHRKPWPKVALGWLLYLVYPYLLWSFGLVAMQNLLASGSNFPLPWSSLLEVGWHPVSLFWFLYALLVAKVFDYVAGLWLGQARAAWFLLVATFGASVAMLLLQMDGFFIYKIVTCAFFYELGRLLSVYRQHFFAWVGALKDRPGLCAVAAGALASCLFGLVWLTSMQYVGSLKPLYAFQDLILLTGIVGTAGLVFLMLLVKRFTLVSGLLQLLGVFSMVIYVQHVFWSSAVRVAMKQLHFAMSAEYVVLLAVVLAGLFLPVVWQRIADRLNITPWFGIKRNA